MCKCLNPLGNIYCLPHGRESTDAEIRVLSDETPELPKVPSCTPGLGQNTALHALPVDRISAVLISAWFIQPHFPQSSSVIM